MRTQPEGEPVIVELPSKIQKANTNDDPSIVEENDEPKSADLRTRNLFICYLFVCLYWGFLETLPGSLFSELKVQLTISDISVTQIFLARAVTFCVAAIITAYIIDRFTSTHRYTSFIFCLSLVSVSLVAFINIVYIQYVVWMSMGFASGLIDVALPVYIFRTFTKQSSSQAVWFVLLTCYGLAKTIIPLLIQFCIVFFNAFSYPLFMVSAVALCAAIFLLILATPQHDKFRTIDKQIARVNSLRDALEVKADMKEYTTLRNIIIVLFTVVLITFYFIQVGLITFVTVYVDEYLHASDFVARSLISTYFGAQLLYRFIIVLCVCKPVRAAMRTTNYLFGILLIGYGIQVVLFMVWASFTILNQNTNVNITIAILFGVFGSTGFLTSATYPAVFELCEAIYPIDGFVSCVFGMAYGFGE
eukprot:122501_1